MVAIASTSLRPSGKGERGGGGGGGYQIAFWGCGGAFAIWWAVGVVELTRADCGQAAGNLRTALTREVRAAGARAHLPTLFKDKQLAFLDFVLRHYVEVRVEELDRDKLTPLLKLRYHDSIADAVADLGPPVVIGQMFADFQKYLYLQAA
ncbi:MAG: hypothetical protein IPK82_20170 [Polyangiaceae bacterium]|nr:hypothetical protein [Polyangiaceae bacterium]